MNDENSQAASTPTQPPAPKTKPRWLVVLKLLLLLYALWSLGLYFLQGQLIFPRHLAQRFAQKGPSDPQTIRLWLPLQKGSSLAVVAQRAPVQHRKPPLAKGSSPHPPRKKEEQTGRGTPSTLSPNGSSPDAPRVEGWFLPGKGIPPQQKNPAVIFFHGNAELIDLWPARLQTYRRWGISLLLPEYRGYGRSDGTPSQRAIASDMRRFHRWLRQHPQVDARRIFYHGRSLGGGIAGQLAADIPPAALILQSTFASITQIARPLLVLPFLLRHPFRTDRVLPHFKGPVLLFHGTYDQIVPVEHARKLHRLAPHSRYYEVSAGHNNLPMNRLFWQRIRGFLGQHHLLPGHHTPRARR